MLVIQYEGRGTRESGGCEMKVLRKRPHHACGHTITLFITHQPLVDWYRAHFRPTGGVDSMLSEVGFRSSSVCDRPNSSQSCCSQVLQGFSKGLMINEEKADTKGSQPLLSTICACVYDKVNDSPGVKQQLLSQQASILSRSTPQNDMTSPIHIQYTYIYVHRYTLQV